MDPLVSILVPAYNVAQYLPQCLKSIVRQSYTHIEVIVVDDGSTDKTGDIAEAWAERHACIKVIHQPNAGLAAVRNVTLAVAKGDYVCFVDSDDYLAPDFVATLLDVAQRHDADYVMCDHTDFNDGEAPEEKVAERITEREYTPEEALRNILYQKGLTHSSWARLYKAEVLAGVHYPEGKIYEDLAVVVPCMAHAHKVVHVNVPLYYYRQQRKGSILNVFSMKRADVLDVLTLVEAQVQASFPNLMPAVMSRRLSASFNMLRLAPRNDERYRDLIARCWEEVKVQRGACLTDGNTRLQNKVASLVSYLGLRPLQSLLHAFTK